MTEPGSAATARKNVDSAPRVWWTNAANAGRLALANPLVGLAAVLNHLSGPVRALSEDRRPRRNAYARSMRRDYEEDHNPGRRLSCGSEDRQEARGEMGPGTRCWRIGRPNIRRLKARFEELLNIPMPQEMAFDGDLSAVGLDLEPRPQTHPDEALLLASEAALRKPVLVALALMSSFFSGQEGYYFVGFHDRGVNNLGFFYSRIDSWSRVYFRLNYGGICRDSQKMRGCIREFLPSYFGFQKRLAGTGHFLLAMECPVYGPYTVISPWGQSFSVDESLKCDPDFEGRFGELLKTL